MNITTRRYPRTAIDAFGCNATEAVALHKYTQPRTTRFFYALLKWGWLAPVLLAVAVLSGCADEAQTYSAAQADLADAVAQAAKEASNAARP